MILFGAIISTSHALFVNTAIVEIFQQVYVVTLFISLIWIMVQRRKAETIVQAFIWSGVFTAGIAVIDYSIGTHFGPMLSGKLDVQYWGRYAGTLGHPNKFGYYLVLTSTLSIAKFIEISLRRSRPIAKLYWGLLIAVQVFGLYLSGSLTAYLGFLLSIIVLVVFSKGLIRQITHYSFPALLLGVPILLFGMIFSNVLPSNSLSPGTSLISKALDRVGSTTAYTRWYIFQEALQTIGDNPLVGAGYDQISTSGIATDFRQLDGTVHNMFLQNWYVGGFFSFIGWLIIYIKLGWMAIATAQLGKKKNISPVLLGIAAAALAIILMDQFQDAVYQREKWLIFGLLVGLSWKLDDLMPHFLTQGGRKEL